MSCLPLARLRPPVVLPSDAQASCGNTYFEHQDITGTERVRTDYTGATAVSYYSLPWGDGYSATTPEGQSNQDNLHFATLDQDAESGTSHATFRQASTTLGRWMSPDPYSGNYDATNPQSMNRYSYVLNNPLAYVDPDGTTGCDSGNDSCAPVGSIWYDQNGNSYMVSSNGELVPVNDQTQYYYVNDDGIDEYFQGQWGPTGGVIGSPGASGVGAGGGRGTPDNGPHYSKSDICAASALLNKGGQTALDALGMIPGEGNVVTGIRLGAGLLSAAISIFGNGSIWGGASAGAGLALESVKANATNIAVNGTEIVPIIGNGVAAAATYNDLKGSDGMGAYYDDCMAGKN